jgi:hypothetical protein
MLNNGQQMSFQLVKDIENRNIKITQYESEIDKLQDANELADAELQEIHCIIEELEQGLRDE